MTSIADIMRTAPVIPVIVVDDLAHAEPLARALVAGGLRVLEVTLRTSGGTRRDPRDEARSGRHRRRGHGDGRGRPRRRAGGRERVHRLAGLTDTLGKAATPRGRAVPAWHRQRG